MRKLVVNPAICDVGHSRANAFCEITYSEDGRLSIHGVVGPIGNGNCKGGAGQCLDEIRSGSPAKGWTRKMLDKYCDIWDEWHLNDMRPECEHQRKMGWKEQAHEPIRIYHYKLNDKAAKCQNEAKNAAMKALKDGAIFRPNGDQIMYANLKYFYDTYERIDAESELARYYVPYKSCTGTPAEEVKIRGWVDIKESPLGILCKPCPVCGYKYGTAWKKEEVPLAVIDWLFSLPKSAIEPAWI